MKNLIYVKNDFVSKEAFARENSQMGFGKFLSRGIRNLLSRATKISCLLHFFSK